MSSKIFPSRGCTYSITDAEGGGDGHYNVDGLKALAGDAGYVLITNVSPTSLDTVQKVQTLGGRNILYTFGKAMGDIQIQGELLLGEVSKKSTGLQHIKDWFDSFRVSKLESTIQVAVGEGNIYEVALTSLTFGHPDPEFNTVQFLATGVTIPPRDTRTE